MTAEPPKPSVIPHPLHDDAQGIRDVLVDAAAVRRNGFGSFAALS